MLAACGFKRRNSEKQYEDAGLIFHRLPHDGSRRKIELRPDSKAWPTCLPALRNLEHILKSAQTVWRGVDDRACAKGVFQITTHARSFDIEIERASAYYVLRNVHLSAPATEGRWKRKSK
jgi:hypothetical protein